jgi:hypothetical protein
VFKKALYNSIPNSVVWRVLENVDVDDAEDIKMLKHLNDG